LPICQGGFVQGARSDGWIIVKESNSFKRLTGVIEISALQLDFAREKTCFRNRYYTTSGDRCDDQNGGTTARSLGKLLK
jgi:hypothetical protein